MKFYATSQSHENAAAGKVTDGRRRCESSAFFYAIFVKGGFFDAVLYNRIYSGRIIWRNNDVPVSDKPPL